MKIRVKRFRFRHQGHTYGAGDIVEMTDKDGGRLISLHPLDYEKAEVSIEKSDLPPSSDDAFEEMSVQELEKYAEKNGIELGGTRKKQSILRIIREAQVEGTADGLPDVDLSNFKR